MNSPPAPPVAPIRAALGRKALPWAGQMEDSHFIVATPSFDELKLSPGIRATRRPLRGRRVRTRRGLVSGLVRWPSEGMSTVRFPSIGCVLDGEADIRSGDYVLHCGAGQFIFFRADTPQPDGSRPHLEGRHLEEGYCDILWFCRWKAGIACSICHSRNSSHEPIRSGEECYVSNNLVIHYFDLLAEEALAQAPGHEKICRGLLLSFLTALLREIEAQRFAPTAAVEATSHPHVPLRQDPDPMRRVQDFVNSHLDQHISIEEAAQLVYMSRAQFTRQFRAATGNSFVQFVNRQRLDKAKTLLQETDFPLDAICLLTGFKVKNFHALFRREIGIPPGEYRRRKRAQ